MKVEKKRPTIITILCVALALGAIINIVIAPLAIWGKEMWYQALAVILWFVGLVTIIGLWEMKKWAVVLYTTCSIVTNIILWREGIWLVEAAFWPAVVMAMMFSQYSKMD